MKRYSFFAFILFAAALFAGDSPSELIPNPGNAKLFAFIVQPQGGQQQVGVCGPEGKPIWSKTAGWRSAYPRIFWSKRGNFLAVVNDYSRNDADLHTPSAAQTNFLFVLKAADGSIVFRADIDRDLLKLPETVAGRAYQNEVAIDEDNGTITVGAKGLMGKDYSTTTSFRPSP